MKRFMQLTSGKGPAECGLAVALALRELIRECEQENFSYEICECIPDEEPGTFQSVLISLGENIPTEFIRSWEGNILWICESPFRKNHRRKNWFIGLSVFTEQINIELNESDIIFSAMKASGPGGQHVNKTLSAVRAEHLPSGIIVTSNESRSQQENKKIAIQKLKDELKARKNEARSEMNKNKWNKHQELERGNAKRIYKGIKFKQSK